MYRIVEQIELARISAVTKSASKFCYPFSRSTRGNIPDCKRSKLGKDVKVLERFQWHNYIGLDLTLTHNVVFAS